MTNSLGRIFGATTAILALAIAPNASAQTPIANAVAETPADPGQQVKCRKIQVTGSLIRKGKVCKTLAEWKRLQQLGNDAARLMAGEHGCSGGECRGLEIQSDIGPQITPR